MSGLVVRDLATGPQSTLSPTQRLVALCLAYYMRRDRECYPSLEVIASWTGLSVSGVRKAIDSDALAGKDGFIEKDTRPGRYSSNVYRLREGVTTGHPEPARVIPQGTLRALPEGGKGVTTSPEGATWAREGATTSHVMSQGMGSGNGVENSFPAKQELIPAKASSTPWLVVARSIWSEGVGTPPQWFENDLRPLVMPSRTSDAVLMALRAYVEATEPKDASTGKFAAKIGAWIKARAKPEPEPYRATPEQIAEKSRRYLEDIAS